MTGFARNRIHDMGPADPPTGMDADNRNHEAFQKAWQERGLVVVYPETIEDEWLRQALINLANKRYLKRA